MNDLKKRETNADEIHAREREYEGLMKRAAALKDEMAVLETEAHQVPVIYRGDSYPRAGLTLNVSLGWPHWGCTIYAPGYHPVGPRGVVESYSGANYGSLGLFVDAFAKGMDIRLHRRSWLRAEKIYAASTTYSDGTGQARLVSGEPFNAGEWSFGKYKHFDLRKSTETGLVEIYSAATNTTLLVAMEDVQLLVSALNDPDIRTETSAG